MKRQRYPWWSWLFLATLSCRQSPPAEASSTLTIASQQDTTVHVAFGADSVIGGWSTCNPTAPLNCTFPAKRGAVKLPLHGQYLNATLAFDAPPGCGATKVELNLNNPKWPDTIDISLVDGFNRAVGVVALENGKSTTLGPVRGKTGNEKAFGVFPYGCDICVARKNPPCGIPRGDAGCKRARSTPQTCRANIKGTPRAAERL